MLEISVKRKPVVVGIMGSHREDAPSMKDAFILGELIAQRGYVLLTGGGTGVMKAASEGAHRAGGFVIAVLPNDRKRPLHDYPNEFVDIPIYTGMYDARNVINAKTPHIIIALGGGSGTLSEIALALRAGTPVIGLGAPRFELTEAISFTPVSTVDEAIRELDRLVDQLLGESS
ncbi:MAG: TIGR00725 family protein [Deltaproteobacteria bacterium]|nr:TIGR00725 family protein [Deltaproteobacteria bacterium]